MRLSARGAQKTRNESKKLSMYSKQWAPGDTLRVLYPIYWENGRPELAVGAVWGHSVADIKGLGLKTAFIPSTNSFNQDGEPIGPADITYQFSMIAGAFVQGSKSIKEASIMKKNFPTEAARREALSKLDEEYDTKNNMNAVKPIIGKAQYYISTEVISVKLVNGVPDKETIGVTSAPLSNLTIDKLYALLEDPKYAPSEGEEFFEVEWKYPVNADKGQSAKAATVSGLTPEYRLATTNPNEWKLVVDKFPTVATEAETITRRATKTVDPVRVRQALTQWSFMHSEDLDAADDDSTEVLLKHADLLKELDLTRALTNTELQAKITEAIQKLDEIAAMSAQETATGDLLAAAAGVNAGTDDAPAISATPDLPDLSNISGAPTIQGLMNNSNAVDMDDADMLAVDLSLNS